MSQTTLHVRFEGRLVAPAELRIARQSGRQFVEFVATVGDGDERIWVEVQSWRSHARDLADRLTTGAAVYVEGRLSHRRDFAPGEPACSLVCAAWLVELLEATP